MRTSRGARRTVRLNCEPLEDRVTPAAAYALSGVGLGTANLLSFDTATPGAVSALAITGVGLTETLVGIDIRPSNGMLYSLGVNVTGTAGTLYIISTTTGVATPVGAANSVDPVEGGINGNAAPPATSGYGFDFNPTVDRLRVVNTGGQSYVVDPNTGVVQTNAPALTAPGTADASGYTNNVPGATATTLYAIDSSTATDQLYIQTPGNSTLTAQGVPLGVNIGTVNGFDIPVGVDVMTSGAAAAGLGFLIGTAGGTTTLYTVDLTTGLAQSLGAISGNPTIAGLAVATGGTVSFQSATVAGAEGGTGVDVVLTRTGGTGPQTVTVAATGGTATAGADFTAGPYTVTFANGATTATLNIPFFSDGALEGPETLTLTITGVSNGTVGAQATTALTVSDTAQRFNQAFGSSVANSSVAVIASGATTPTFFSPYGQFPTGVRVAVGDVTGDGIDDLVTVPTIGVPLVKVFSGDTGLEVASFLAYPAAFNIPASIAVGDVNNDGFDDIIVGTTTTLAAVLVFSGQDFTMLRTPFTPFGAYPFGVNVASGDVNGDGFDDIIVGTSSGLAVVGAYSGLDFAPLHFFLPYGGFAGGVTVASGDFDADGRADIVVGSASVVPVVSVFSGQTGAQQRVITPFNLVAAGVNVAVGDVNSDGRPDIISGLASALAATVAIDGGNLTVLNNILPFGLLGTGVFVA